MKIGQIGTTHFQKYKLHNSFGWTWYGIDEQQLAK
jgi:hypothetical protein